MDKIKIVCHIADVHIRPFRRLEEYAEKLNDFKNKLINELKGYKKEEVRIVISGDICHNKLDITSELIAFVSSWIRELEEIAKVIVISGNHDIMSGNLSRVDPLSAIFTAAKFKNALHLDSYLGYDSGIVADNNITWALYSIFSDFRKPNIEQAKIDFPTNTVVGLYHGTIVGATLFNGTEMDSGVSSDIFDGCDMVMAGDIHKRQEIKRGDVKILYPGSLIQQTFGETVTQHGFALWNIEEKSYRFIDLDDDYSLYDFKITSPEDIDNDKERLINY